MLYRMSGASVVLGCVLLAVGDVTRIVVGTDPGDARVGSTSWRLNASRNRRIVSV